MCVIEREVPIGSVMFFSVRFPTSDLCGSSRSWSPPCGAWIVMNES